MAFPINALVQETTHFKPLPQAALRLVGILGREDWAPEEVIDVVKHDPVLTGRVLGAANSATFSGKAKILSLEEALRRIGPRAVVGIAVADGVRGQMSSSLPQFGLAEGELWRHSVAALIAAELASAYFRIPYSAAAVTGSLLHDVGKVVMARFLDPETLQYLELARVQGGETRREAEIEILTVTHGELGGLIVAHWGMPEEIVRAVQYHHDLANVPSAHRQAAALVQLADGVAKVVVPHASRSDDDPSELASALEILGARAEVFPEFCEAVAALYKKTGGAY